MHGINLKALPVVLAASTLARPAMSSSVWKSKLEAEAENNSEKMARLFLEAGIIGKEQYCDAAEIAESLHKSIDQVIVTSFLSDEQAVLCASAMHFLECDIINETLAADALRTANARGLTFREGLSYFGFGW